MKDFPIFSTEYGAASLVLHEIPYRQEAYVWLQATDQPQQLLHECVSFCRAAGAETVFAQGDGFLERYPLHTVIYEMRGEARVDECKVEHLWPVTEKTVGRWRALMNERMAGVDNAGTLERKEEKKILESGGAYFIHRSGELLGIGWLKDGGIKAVASLVPGAGERVMHTLFSLIPGESVRLEVISTNHRAIRLYEKLGFIRTREAGRWYRVHP